MYNNLAVTILHIAQVHEELPNEQGKKSETKIEK